MISDTLNVVFYNMYVHSRAGYVPLQKILPVYALIRKLHYFLIIYGQTTPLFIRPLVIFLLASASQLALADDIVSAVSKGEPDPISENGGFFEIGVNAVSGQRALIHDRPKTGKSAFSGLSIEIHGSYRYKRAFIEAARSGFDGLNLGFSLWQNEYWTIDFLAANLAGRVTDDSDNPAPVTEADKNAGILDRDTLFIAAGTRITRYFDNNRIAQFRLVSDYYDNNGVLASVRLGQQWQFGNWSWTGFLGAKYTSRRFNNYLVGISADDYLGKPVTPRILLARVRALLRRGKPSASTTQVTVGSLLIDTESRTVKLDDEIVSVSTHEFDVLLLLANNVGQALSRDALVSEIRGIEYDGFDRSVDVCISRLRRKLHDDANTPIRQSASKP